jgi:Ser-tRNA(Ala) deacylase AlaX
VKDLKTLTSKDKKKIDIDIDLSKLPENASQTLRLIYVGDYESCACMGEHVQNTNEIGEFKITSSNFEEGRLRIPYKLLNSTYIS